MDLEYLRASDGNGPAAPATVTVGRLSGATTIKVNAVTNWPDKFIGTYGVFNADTSRLEVSSIRVFLGHLDGADIIIDDFAPGFADDGNSIGDKVYIKPASAFSDMIADLFSVAHDPDGDIKSTVIDGIKSDVLTGVGTMTNKRIQSRVYSTTTTTTLAPNIANYNVYTVTAIGAGMSISNPTGTPVDGEVIIFRLKDSGTTRALTWGNAFVGIGDALLANTVAGKWHYINGMYNGNTSKWDILPTITQG